MAKRLCTEFVDQAIIAPIVACSLVPLDNNPGSWRKIALDNVAVTLTVASESEQKD